VPEFAERVRAAERVAPFLGGAVQNEFRTPLGPDWLDGRAGFDEVLAAWQAARDAAVLPMFEFTAQLASLEEPPPEMQQLPPTEFFSPDNVGAIMSAA